MSTAVQVRSAVVLHGVASCSPAPQLRHSLQLAAPRSAANVTPATHSVRPFSPPADEKPASTSRHVRCVAVDTLHGTSSYSPAPQSMHSTHEKPVPVALSHSPTQKVSASSHARLKHAACSLLPSAEKCSASTGWQVRSAVAVQL